MPRRKRNSSPFELFDDDLDDDSQSSRNGNPPIQRNAANARERARMRVLSSAFGRLKTKLPNIPPDTKLSKLDTLRLATMYIKNLRAMAEGNVSASMNVDAIGPMQFTEHGSIFGNTSSTQNLSSWPFGLHHIQNSTNRQLPNNNQCPSMMDWNSAGTDSTKCADFESYAITAAQPHQSPTVTPPWFSATPHNTNSMASAHSFHSNNFNICSNSNQIQQHHHPNQQLSHAYAMHHSQHHQSTTTPIR